MNRLFKMNKTCDGCGHRMGAHGEGFDDHLIPSARRGIAHECYGGDGRVIGKTRAISDVDFERICDRFGI